MPAKYKPAAGTVLVAEPMMSDLNFRRTIVLLCEHNQEGSFGLVLNEELPFALADVLSYPSAFEAPLRRGGPCEPETLHVLHTYPEIPDCLMIAQGLYWGGDFEMIEEWLENGNLNPARIAFFIGYSGWSAGQLGRELKRNDWFMTQVQADWVFAQDQEKMWRKVLWEMGGEFRYLANFPDDPRLN